MMKRREQNKKQDFTPIKMEDFIELHLKSNPDTSRQEVEEGLKSALDDHKQGVRCDCGNAIWVIGSAFVGNGCFTCITGESEPDDDYEIDEAMK